MPSTEPANVETPRHPAAQMTTFELREYRRQLESAIAFFDRSDPVPPARGDLQARLDAVISEQDERARLVSRSERADRSVTSEPDNLPEMVPRGTSTTARSAKLF